MADEKTQEKTDEKNEKEVEKREEKWRRDPLGSIVGAIILIWAGVVLLAQNMGYMDSLTGILDNLGVAAYSLPFDWVFPFISPRAIQVFLLGTGCIIVVEALLRLIIPRFRRGIFGSLIGAIVCFALALGNWQVIWPLIIIAIGLSILVGALTRRPRL